MVVVSDVLLLLSVSGIIAHIWLKVYRPGKDASCQERLTFEVSPVDSVGAET